ncbi:MAG: substrate-binding domain-containing protein, partial [Hyphomicrobiaceae bacterium]|nr:substrate-binding domain-containing protein [Hyphomicrobiaceae bacterium]
SASFWSAISACRGPSLPKDFAFAVRKSDARQRPRCRAPGAGVWRLSITGFDDLDMIADIEPPLARVRVPSREIGERVAQFLTARIEGRAVTGIVELTTTLGHTQLDDAGSASAIAVNGAADREVQPAPGTCLAATRPRA